MQIDLRTVSIQPLRQTFDPVAEHIGGDKPASRYLEGTIGIQAEDNFHYRPLWAPEYEIFDASRTAIQMSDWYKLKDPRQFYYGTYTLSRARMQDTAEADFDFVEERGLADSYPEAAKKLALDVLLPLRHVEWAGNMNSTFICAYGYGAAITQPCIYQAMDHLGMAQYLTRLGLLMDDAPALDAAKEAWLKDAKWQELRRYVEDTFVLEDWFEVFVAHNLALDGLLYPLVYQQIDKVLNAQGGPVVSMLTRFQSEWYTENVKWVDASIKIAAAESAENKAKLSAWTKAWRDRAIVAMKPIAEFALGADGAAQMETLIQQFNDRAAKLGLAL
ncbi:MAG: phenol hydroxylase [Rhodocyclaceae bacterium]|nr:MAG: phenol hydroxylase [Rhodocyclaceae bacterium]